MDLPSNPSKGIYVVEAYHSLHCLVCLLLRHFMSVSSEKLTLADDDSEVIYSVHPKLTPNNSDAPYQPLL